MSDSKETNELDSYGVWVKNPPKTVDSSETSVNSDDAFNFDTDLPDFSDLDVIDEPSDISASDNSAVCAALEGTVICVVWNEDSGYTLVLQHKGEVSSVYSRCEKVLRNVGDKVSAGTPLGLVAPGDFLHFELWYKGTPEDPCKYLSIQ